jgi:N-methylhydantoinase B
VHGAGFTSGLPASRGANPSPPASACHREPAIRGCDPASHLYVDNAGTDPQAGSINVTYAGFSGAFLAALTASLTADLAGAYGGVYRRVHFEPVPGTLACADFPAAVSPAGIYTMETLISLSGAAIGKMLACAEPEVAKLAIGPAHPVFYGFISGGVHPAGQPFVATNADNMIGSLAASPAGDGVDFGGHFWIPEGTASNIEELELLWPMLFLYRRALKAGADGAGRFRGGRGFVEAGIPWTVPGLAAAVYVDESFPKAVGPFGGNPGSAGHFRLKHGTDVTARLAAGEVPQDFDAIDGAEPEIEAKGPMLMMGADAAWEWTGANAPGFGDPLTRDPGLVEADIANGVLSAATAERVYGVVPGDGARTRAQRAERLAARLAGAVPPAVPLETVPADMPLRVLAGELAMVERDGRPEAFVTVAGRAVLAPAGGNFKDGCAVLERPLRTVALEFTTRPGRAGYLMRYREYLCPVTGLRVDSEILVDGDEALHDIVIGEPAGFPT